MKATLVANRIVQSFLKSDGTYLGLIDNVWGPKSQDAVRRFAAKLPKYSPAWDDARCRVAVEQFIIKAAGFDTGVVDGLIGPQTLSALERYQDSLVKSGALGDSGPLVKPVVAGVKQWPRQTQSELRKFFGEPGTRQTQCHVPFTMQLAWDPKAKLNKFSCHELVKEPFERIFAAALAHYGIEALEKMGITKFGGCLNVRAMRGGSSMSLHSWGIAVDLDPARNQFRWTAAQAVFDEPEYEVWWQIVESEGMVSLGRERNFDWMHFQAARL